MCSTKTIIIIIGALIILYMLTKMNKAKKQRENLSPQDQLLNTANTVTASAKTVFGFK
jgi:hypothetical protein